MLVGRMRKLKYAHSFEVFRELPNSLTPLKDLAYNLRWSWHHDTQALFHDIDVDLWHSCNHNPVELLNTVSPDRLAMLEEDEVARGCQTVTSAVVRKLQAATVR